MTELDRIDQELAALRQEKRRIDAQIADLENRRRNIQHWRAEYGIGPGDRMIVSQEAHDIICQNHSGPFDSTGEGTGRLWPVGMVVEFAWLKADSVEIKVSGHEKDHAVGSIPIPVAQAMRADYLDGLATKKVSRTATTVRGSRK